MKPYVFITDPDGVIVELTVDGKPYAMRGLDKAQKTPYWRLFSDGGEYGGVLLDGFQKSILNFVKIWENRFNTGGVELAGAPIQTFDEMRYLFLALDSDAYMQILD